MERLNFFFRGFKVGFGELGHGVSKLINIFLLLLVYIFGVGLISISSKIRKKNFLNMKPSEVSTYWTDKINRNKNLEDSSKPF